MANTAFVSWTAYAAWRETGEHPPAWELAWMGGGFEWHATNPRYAQQP